MIRSLRTPLTTAAQDVETIGATAVEWLSVESGDGIMRRRSPRGTFGHADSHSQRSAEAAVLETWKASAIKTSRTSRGCPSEQ
jgi:hypothetical protein